MRHWRINLILFLFIIFAAAIIGRLLYLQIINHQYWRALAQGQQKLFVSLQGARGEIFFADNKKAALNQNFNSVYAVPDKIENLEETASALSLFLNLDKNLILEKIRKENFYNEQDAQYIGRRTARYEIKDSSLPEGQDVSPGTSSFEADSSRRELREIPAVKIKKKITEEEIANLKNLNLNGINFEEFSGRYYPFETLAAQLIGFLGGDGQGQYGIEGYYDGILCGKEKFLEKEKGPGGYLITSRPETAEKGESSPSNDFSPRGSDLILTIDYNIQFMAEKLLADNKEKLNFEEGEIIVAEPDTGKILALAVYPGFNLNQYSEVKDLAIFQNPAIQKVFEPGSVFKSITMAAVLDQEKLTPETSYVDQGYLKIGEHKISNFDNRVWGERTMTEVLANSINTGAVFAQRQLGRDIFGDYLQKFGIFELTGIDLQGEIFSQNKEFKKGYEINLATASFGQGIEMTSLQLIRAYVAIANGGKLLRPYLADKILENGKIIENKPEIQNPSVISQKAATQLTAMLVNVVEKGGARKAKIPGYSIAGKTGTAQIPWTSLGIKKKGYSEKTMQSFIGYAPAFDPKFVILVKINNPNVITAELSAVPIFRDMAKYIIDYWQIPSEY